MMRDLAIPWQDLRSNLHTDLEGAKTHVEELMDWAVEYLGTVEVDISLSGH